MNVALNVDNKDPLSGVFLSIGVKDIINEAAILDVENHILKRDTSLFD